MDRDKCLVPGIVCAALLACDVSSLEGRSEHPVQCRVM